MSDIRHATLDGSEVHLTAGVDLARPFASFASFNIGGRLQEFAAGRLDYGEMVAREADVQLDEEYSHRGGRLRIGKKSQFDDQTRIESSYRLAVWEGEEFSLKTFLWNAPSSDLIGLLDRFSLRETPIGLTITSLDTDITLERELRTPTLVQNLPSMGLLEMRELDARATQGLPSWDGYPVPGGELFVEDSGSEEMTFLIVGENSITRLYPNWWEAGTEDILARFVETVVEWRRDGSG